MGSVFIGIPVLGRKSKLLQPQNMVPRYTNSQACYHATLTQLLLHSDHDRSASVFQRDPSWETVKLFRIVENHADLNRITGQTVRRTKDL